MTATREMPKYQCHKQVWALKIKTVAVHASGDAAVSDADFVASDAFQGAHLVPAEEGYAPVHVSADWFRKHKPEAGGYYVVYEDGYKSYSPASAFESGYTSRAAGTTKLPVMDPGPDSLEREIQAKADKGPRVTPAALQAEIVSEFYFTAFDGVVGSAAKVKASSPLVMVELAMVEYEEKAEPSLNLLTFCVLVLRNGFTVIGHSAVASPENFNKEIGERIARENAEREIWPLLGFRLRDELAR